MRKQSRPIILVSFVLFFLISPSHAVEVQDNMPYEVVNGWIETGNNGRVDIGEKIQVLRDHDGWGVVFKRLEKKSGQYKPVGPELIASRKFVELAVENLNLTEATVLTLGINQVTSSAGEPPCNCPPKDIIEAQVSENNLGRIRPVARKRDFVSEPMGLNRLKSPKEVDQYFACHKYSENTFLDYADKYKKSIRNMAEVYARKSGKDLNQEEVMTLMSCLLFRESWAWRGISSPRGAVGLGQFTDITIKQIKRFVSHDIGPGNYDERDEIQRSEHAAGRLSAAKLRKNLSLINDERVKNERFNELRRLWDAMPMQNRPSASQITENFLKNNDNHEAIMALSALVVKNCQIRLKERSYEMDPMTSLFACSGGYNMGPGGIKNEALDRRGGPQNLRVWLENLKNSNHRQRRETHNHYVSIYRCMNQDQNFPQCGTRPDFCTALPKADQCAFGADPSCWMEDREKECPWPAN